MNRFAEWLKTMLDQTGLFTRAQWAQFLDVADFMIEGWLREISLPRPEKLRSIVRVLLESDGVTGARERLSVIELLPLSEISGLPREAWRGANTLAEYLCLPLVDGLRRSMAGLTMEQQEQVLFNAAEESRRIKGIA